MKKKKNLYELIEAINNLGELNIVLNLLKKDNLERWVLKRCIYNRSGVVEKIPNANDLIELSIRLKLVYSRQKRNKKLIILSHLGRKFLAFKQIEKDRLLKDQGMFLLSKVFRQIGFLKDISSVAQIFNEDADGNLWINSNDRRIKDFEGLILRILQQIKVAKYSDAKIIIDNADKNEVLDILCIGSEINYDTFLKILKQKQLYGRLAEKFVEDMEKSRLTSIGREDLADLVKRISDQDISAGYDVRSFDGLTSDTRPDRFIEVKGNASGQMIFYFSKNEIDTARRMNKKYWIYCVLNVKSPALRKLIMIKNPYMVIFKKKNLKADAVMWKVYDPEYKN